MFSEEIIMMLFEETGADFDDWSSQYDYASMTDQAIYAAFPDAVKAACADIGLNASWMHHGL